jgi:methionyl-tRNA formyltransferase
MKIAACVANLVGRDLAIFLTEKECDLDFVITCKDDPYEEEIYDIFSSHGILCYRKIDANSDFFINKLKSNRIDLVFLLWWPDIINKDVIDSANTGFINLHPSLLPFNRGKHPYYWSIVEGTPAGVSLHFINPGIDDGDILFQREIETSITTTGESLYAESLKCITELFMDSYEKIINGDLNPKKQSSENYTFHYGKDIVKHSEIDLNKEYRAIDLINIIRAKSFNKRPSTHFMLDDKKYYINIDIREAE